MKCPVCIEPDLTMSDRQGVEIDYCPKCRGVWLDRGELDKIIDRAGQDAAPPRQAAPGTPLPPPTGAYAARKMDDSDVYPAQGGHHPQYGYKKKKHWLSELFD